MLKATLILLLIFNLYACTSTSGPAPDVAETSVDPGSSVSMQGESIDLYDGSFKVGDKLTDIAHGVILPIEGSVSVISVVPSVDTAVCEEQTHILGESTQLHPSVLRITVSRDLPMAQQRFAADAGLQNIKYLSDYKTGSFGKSTGLMMKDKELLARAVIVTDANGIIRHFQVVPDITHLPDMQKAIDVANRLVEQ